VLDQKIVVASFQVTGWLTIRMSVQDNESTAEIQRDQLEVEDTACVFLPELA